MPLVLSVSARLPASIQTPTVEVCAHGECSVAIYGLVSLADSTILSVVHTVKPFESVVLSVFVPWLTGVARPLLSGWIELSAVRLRNA